MEKFIEKMEYLFDMNRGVFMTILIAVTLIGLFLFGGNTGYFYLPVEISIVYIESGKWMLLVAGVLWLIVFGDSKESLDQDKTFDNFLVSHKDIFTRQDFAKYVYDSDKDIPSSSSEYKKLGRVLRRAVAQRKIKEQNPGENPRRYQKI